MAQTQAYSKRLEPLPELNGEQTPRPNATAFSYRWALLALALVAAAAYVFWPYQGPASADGNLNSIFASAGSGDARLLSGSQVQMALMPAQPLEGQPVQAQVLLGSCSRQGAQLKLDAKAVAFEWLPDGSGLAAQLEPAAGSHRLEFSSSQEGCRAVVEFAMMAPQCAAGQNRSCTLADACGGTQRCETGQWTPCQPKPHICRPGEEVACSSNTCAFGRAACNACGDGWSECRPPAQ